MISEGGVFCLDMKIVPNCTAFLLSHQHLRVREKPLFAMAACSHGQEGESPEAEILAFMRNPESYRPLGIACQSVDMIETHGARVFLAGDKAFKIKRPVRYAFFDFSTRAKRKAVIERELAVNRSAAPMIYERILPITEAGGRYQFEGGGEPVEWVLKMARFNHADELDRVAERDALDGPLAEGLGRMVATLHNSAIPSLNPPPSADLQGVADALAAGILEETAVLWGDDACRFADTVRRCGTANAALLDKRRAHGLIRRCHGDLHLKNIVLIDGEPVAFDAIEFDEALATIDIGYDLAFLMMDLWVRGMRSCANRVFNGYLKTANPEWADGLFRLLPFFLSLRAAVRARVGAARANLLDGDEKTEAVADARRYLSFASSFLEPPPSQLIAIGGLSGTGKTVLAEALAPNIGPAPGAVHLRSDVLRKRLWDVDEFSSLPADAYTPEASARTYRALYRESRRVIAEGHGAVVDAVAARADERDAIEAVACNASVSFSGIWLQAPLDRRVERVTHRAGSVKQDASDADAQIAERQESYRTGRIAWNCIDTGGTFEETLQAARAVLHIEGGDECDEEVRKGC